METIGGDGEQMVAKRPRILQRLLQLVALASTVVFALAMLGYVVRDRTWWLALLMYLPMPLIAPAAFVAQLAAMERQRWRRRMVVIVLAAVAALISLRGMVGRPVDGPTEGAIKVVQWNVQWGRNGSGWTETVRQIEQSKPDIIILSEAPSDEKILSLAARLGAEWSITVARNQPGARYWYAMAVMSRWPLSETHDVSLPNGAAHAVTIATPGSPIRVLAVDGMSDPKIPRTPMLHAVAKMSASVDLIAGDFNAVSRSVEFDQLEAQGFHLVSHACDGWRGTYPANVPMYDIDHIWSGNLYVPFKCAMLDSPGTNHRGQVAYLQRSS